ncbi:MAG: UDP-3-O-acylglucosamine N-acyltransferase [Planctomycetota bacterium]
MTTAAHTSASIAKLVGGTLTGPSGVPVAGLNTAAEAGPDQLTFVGDLVNANRWSAGRAGTVIVGSGIELPGDDGTRAVIRVVDADLAMIPVLELFFAGDPKPDPGVAAAARIHPSAAVDPTARIAPGAVVGPRCTVGAGAVLHANAVMYDDAHLGAGSMLHAGAVLRERCVVGARCIVGANAVIGGDGFGYRASADGRSVLRIPHLGNVVLEDDVEIGSGAMIDRGKFGATRIGAGSKIDNLCQIGHNVSIGRMCMISGHTGIAGSVQVGDGVQMGGGVGIAPHLRIGSGARIAARAAVMCDIPAGETWGGYPAQDVRLALREQAAIRRLCASAKPLLRLLKDEKSPD